MKVFRWLLDNILFVVVAFLLAFIPLWPKIPLINVKNTWVYVRLDDFVVAFSVLLFLLQLFRKKATLMTPLTWPIVGFWVVGALSTTVAFFYTFPYLPNIYPHVVLLNYIRHIEYLSVFFVGYAAIRYTKKTVPILVFVLSVTLLSVFIYGVGQRLYGFPAYLTMNEEFAKGVPLRLSALARIPSTFAGHYDLAAYLILMIPLLASMVFGFKNIFAKIFLFLTALSSLALLLMTASRVSFGVYLLTISFMLMLQKKKIWIIPVIVISIMLININLFKGLSERFGSTITQVDLVVDARTGKAVGVAKEIQENESSQQKKTVVIENKQSTGEYLPQGSGYINLPKKSEQQVVTHIIQKSSKITEGIESSQIVNIEGDFVVKRVLAYDVSFTTRFQGQWPRAFEAFQRNYLLGSGYSSISLASDNNYLRMLGEIGALGLGSFALIFLVFGIYVYRVLPYVNSPAAKSFIIGACAGIFGLGLNAVLIDVFEASKVAYIMWIFIGITTGTLHFYQKNTINFLSELQQVFRSIPAMMLYLFLITFIIFWGSLTNYFAGDDFTWFRWIADCKKIVDTNGVTQCEPIQVTLLNYFTDAGGFFYRPGAKLYYFVMYSIFGLNQIAYHVMSVFFHGLVSSLVLLFALKILKNKFFAFLSALIFVTLSAHAETVFWIASTGHLIASGFVLGSVVSFMQYRENKGILFLPLSILCAIAAPLFHELGIVAPLFIIVFDSLYYNYKKQRIISYLGRWYYLIFLLIIPTYLSMRYLAHSHWLNGDYSYNVVKLPYNVVGNILGYVGLSITGTQFLPIYTYIRSTLRSEIFSVFIGLFVLLVVSCVIVFFAREKITYARIRVYIACILLFLMPLLPFLGLGNITERYSYLASSGIIIAVIYLVQSVATKKKRNLVLLPVIFTLIIFFVCFHIQELQRINADWKKAGEITNNVLVSFHGSLSNTTPNPVFYFVNTPIRIGEAWVFPVGLPDALWFTFQNSNLTVYTAGSVDLALDAAQGSARVHVFEFHKDGTIEVIRVKGVRSRKK